MSAYQFTKQQRLRLLKLEVTESQIEALELALPNGARWLVGEPLNGEVMKELAHLSEASAELKKILIKISQANENNLAVCNAFLWFDLEEDRLSENCPDIINSLDRTLGCVAEVEVICAAAIKSLKDSPQTRKKMYGPVFAIEYALGRELNRNTTDTEIVAVFYEALEINIGIKQERSASPDSVIRKYIDYRSKSIN